MNYKFIFILTIETSLAKPFFEMKGLIIFFVVIVSLSQIFTFCNIHISNLVIISDSSVACSEIYLKQLIYNSVEMVFQH